MSSEMWLKQLRVLNFKNYSEAELDFSPQANAITGKNGSGKTNILDAIHYLSLCKSYFNPIDSQQIKKGENWFMVQGDFHKEESEDKISCSLKRNQKKLFERNKKKYSRLADHIGLYPIVMVTPNDTVIVMGGSEERRRFMDNVISQTDAEYLDHLIVYNKVLQQRNALLKKASEKGFLDDSLLAIFDQQLVGAGVQIFKKRNAFLSLFLPKFNEHYKYLSAGAEEVRLMYKSPLSEDDFMSVLQGNKEKDLVLGRTTQGIHRDDLVFEIHEEMPLKKFGSQGQQKSFLIALKLAQYSFLKEKKSFPPLLLLDDIFDKLDEVRVEKLMDMVSNGTFGQIFITDTDALRTQAVFEKINKPIRLFEVEDGQLTQK